MDSYNVTLTVVNAETAVFFPECHTGFNIQLCLDSMIEHLGLDNRTMELFCINDNASNMKLAIKKSNYLTQYLCDIHTLELVIKDAIKNTPGMADILKKKLNLLQSLSLKVLVLHYQASKMLVKEII